MQFIVNSSASRIWKTQLSMYSLFYINCGSQYMQTSQKVVFQNKSKSSLGGIMTVKWRRNVWIFRVWTWNHDKLLICKTTFYAALVYFTVNILYSAEKSDWLWSYGKLTVNPKRHGLNSTYDIGGGGEGWINPSPLSLELGIAGPPKLDKIIYRNRMTFCPLLHEF